MNCFQNKEDFEFSEKSIKFNKEKDNQTKKMKSNQKQSSQSLNRAQNTIKKSQSVQGFQNKMEHLGKYRQLGPKVHEFGGTPPSNLGMSQSFKGRVGNTQSPSQVSHKSNDQDKSNSLKYRQSFSHHQQSQQQKLNEQQQNIPSLFYKNGYNKINSFNYKRTGDQQNTSGLQKKKNSISTINSPQNISNRSNGWAQNNSNRNNGTPTNSNQHGQYLDRCDSVQSMDQLSDAETGQNISNLKTQLRTIFHFYTTFGDRQNITFLKSNKFYKMMADANVVSNILTVNRLDLLFCQANKHQSNMTFETFLDLLPKLAALKYPNSSTEEAMLLLITNELNPLYVSIMERTDLGLELRSFSQPLEIDCIEVLTPLYPILQKIYESYFKWEPSSSMTKEQTYNRSLKALFQFLSEYNICPTYYTKSTAFLLYNYLIELKNLNYQFAVSENTKIIFGFQDYGVKFSFQRFLLYLVRSSIICYDNRLDNTKYVCSSLVEKLNLLLEKMEVSEGFLNIQKKTHITNNSHTSLLIPSALVTRLSENKSIDWSTPRTSQYCSFRSKLNSGQQSTRQQSFYNPPASVSPSRSNSNLRKSYLVEKLGQSFVSISVFERNNEGLQKIFKNYCSYGEPLNQTTLKTMKLIRLLTDAGIIKKPKPSLNSSNNLNMSEIKRSMSNSNTANNLRGSQTPQASQQRTASNNIQFSFLANNGDEQVKEQRFLSKIDMDFMVVKLTGHKWVQSFNQQANQFDSRIVSPKLGFSNYMFKNDESQGAKGKIEYEHFIKLLEMIAEKLYPELQLEQSLQIIVEGQILKLQELVQANRKGMHDYLANLMEILKDQDIVNLLGEVHLSLVMYYKLYQDQKGYMNIANFIKFFQDFDIFPSLASKAKLQAIFYTLAQVQANQKNSRQKSASESIHNTSKGSQLFLNDSNIKYAPDQNEAEIIDQHLFVEGVAILAMEIYSEKQSNIHKIIMILERMNSSQGPIQIQKSLGHTRSPDGLHWDMLYNIRKKYPEFYRRENYATITNQSKYNIDNMNQSSQSKSKFDDVMKRSLSSVKLQNSNMSLNLSQQYLLQQKEINEKSNFYLSNYNNQSGIQQQNHSVNTSDNQRLSKEILQNESHQLNQTNNSTIQYQNNVNSPINGQNINQNSFDTNETAKKGRTTPKDINNFKQQQQQQQQQPTNTYDSPNFVTHQTHQ